MKTLSRVVNMVSILLFVTAAMLHAFVISLTLSTLSIVKLTASAWQIQNKKGGDMQGISHSVWQHGLLVNQHST